MPTSNFIVQYHNFHPSQATKEYIQNVLSEMQQELPGGATARAIFSMKDKVVTGTLQVGSYYGPFFSSAAADDLHLVTVKLVEQVRRRLEKFKSKRRSHKGLKQSLKQHVYNSEPMVTGTVTAETVATVA